ncbi:MAG: hypothetical protein LC687_04020 [Actinobacteria bacterium]|nr:hypothetical protein [Actinomycetota bacterium]
MDISKKKAILDQYAEMYKLMLKNGILDLEEYLEKNELLIPGFEIPMEVFVWNGPGKAALEKFEEQEDVLRKEQGDLTYEWLYKLGRYFWVVCENLFARTATFKRDPDEVVPLEDAYAEIDRFVKGMSLKETS